MTPTSIPRVIVGLTGYARSGKDTSAAILGDKFGFTRVAFADRLREMAISEEHDIRLADGRALSQVVATVGWEGVKADPMAAKPARVHLQELGVAIRESHGAGFWVERVSELVAAAGLTRVVVSDVRFDNEAQWVIDGGGIVIRLHRPGVGPANLHVSERPLPDRLVHAEVRNDGTIAALAAKLGAVVRAVWSLSEAA